MAMPKPDSVSTPDPGLGALFFAFFGISLMGFGGVMPWARWMVVEKRGWLTSAEFNEAMALCQFLPGGNIINFGVIVGNRFRGVAGAVSAVSGMMIGPFFLVIALASLYGRYAELPGVHGALIGISAAAAGLVTAMTAKMAIAMKGEWVALLFALAGFAAVGVFRVPLYIAVAVIAPVTILYAWRRVA
jgi:chromate transporter